MADEVGGRCEAGTELFVPWVVDGIAPVERSRFLTALPAPLRERKRVMWEPPLPQAAPVESVTAVPASGAGVTRGQRGR